MASLAPWRFKRLKISIDRRVQRLAHVRIVGDRAHQHHLAGGAGHTFSRRYPEVTVSLDVTNRVALLMQLAAEAFRDFMLKEARALLSQISPGQTGFCGSGSRERYRLAAARRSLRYLLKSLLR